MCEIEKIIDQKIEYAIDNFDWENCIDNLTELAVDKIDINDIASDVASEVDQYIDIDSISAELLSRAYDCPDVEKFIKNIFEDFINDKNFTNALKLKKLEDLENENRDLKERLKLLENKVSSLEPLHKIAAVVKRITYLR